ncbi:PREDICTED: phosphatidylinositol 5-phosphate 4-kinase type-2 gamma-like [Nipponia nippon]|uniref:phosphatidylinositol 5-phosphate 4-kinase type-2 gamma-like n=1 Tax=Nipponia nippon TaxID=128390 RepID=UPI0005109A2E|nr:PREDICTED: phosphatidylinositol 5-phosphate 4-kinase type-2 gamma-like [Nipponia nippon]
MGALVVTDALLWINELSQVPLPVMLLPDDFKASSKIKVNNHLFNRENLPSHFKFKEYCPQVFRNLRERFGIDDQDYQVSLTRSPPHWEGSDRRFLLSSDRTLVVKELSSEDVADVHGLLSHYHQYVVQCHGSTLLPRFLGMYRVSVDSEETYLLVMRNMFSHRLPVHRKYDLKDCITRALQVKTACPMCGRFYGQLVGNQPPNGRMLVTRDAGLLLPGYEKFGTIIIQYVFPPGVQGVRWRRHLPPEGVGGL